MKLESYGNPVCGTMPQHTSWFPYFSYLGVFAISEKEAQVKIAYKIRISSWIWYLSQLRVTGPNGPWNPIQFCESSTAEHLCHAEGMKAVQDKPDALQQQ